MVPLYRSLFPFHLCPCVRRLSMESKTLHRLGVCRVVKASLDQFQPSIWHPVSDVRRTYASKYSAGSDTTVQRWGTQNLSVEASFKMWKCYLLSTLCKISYKYLFLVKRIQIVAVITSENSFNKQQCAINSCLRNSQFAIIVISIILLFFKIVI